MQDYVFDSPKGLSGAGIEVQTPAGERLFTGNFLLLWASAFTAFAGFQMTLPVLPLYVTRVGGTESQIGLVVGVLAMSSVVTRPWLGRAADRRGKKLVLVWGALGLAASTFSYPLAASIPLLLVLRVFHGVPWAAASTSSFAMVPDISPKKRLGEALGYFGTASNLAMAAGPLLGVALVESFGFNPMFLTASGLSLIALLAAWRIREPQRSLHAQSVPAGPAPRRPVWASFIYRPALFPSTIALILAMTYGGMVTFVPLLAYKHQVNPGLFFTVYAVALLVVRPLGGRLSDLAGRSAPIVPGTLFIASGIGILAFATALPHFLASAVLVGVGFSLATPALMALTIDRATAETGGEAMATFTAAFDMGIGLGAIFLGMLLERTNDGVFYLTLAGIAVFGLMAFLAGGMRHRRAVGARQRP